MLIELFLILLNHHILYFIFILYLFLIRFGPFQLVSQGFQLELIWSDLHLDSIKVVFDHLTKSIKVVLDQSYKTVIIGLRITISLCEHTHTLITEKLDFIQDCLQTVVYLLRIRTAVMKGCLFVCLYVLEHLVTFINIQKTLLLI